ncbi:hypothetical protein PSY81_23845, partial [Shigella flexneri]|nr:hypothetical protein [Shigella flexneri]
NQQCPRPDGFNSYFYKAAWDIIEKDIFEAAVDFFSGSVWPQYFSSTFIVLVAKTDNPSDIHHFRPINLCSTFYKACT